MRSGRNEGVDAIHRYYAPKVAVRSPDGVVIGNEEVINATLATLAEFPDRQLLGEDVIWSGDEDSGFLSSHRILSTATHLGDGAYGPASGTRLRYRIIADCACRENQIYDEWLIRDQGAIVRQLGIDPKRFAAGPDRQRGWIFPRRNNHFRQQSTKKPGTREPATITRLGSRTPRPSNRSCRAAWP